MYPFNIIMFTTSESFGKALNVNSKSITFYNAFEKVVGLSIEDFQKLPQTDSIDVLLKAGLTYSQQNKLDKVKDYCPMIFEWMYLV